MKKAVIYARHSSDKQTTSTQDQIERCKKFCLVKGYKLEQIFSDEAISGGAPIKLRKGIQDLLDMAVVDCFQVIVCEDLSRLSRDQGDIAHFFKKMMFLDIDIETVTEGLINELHIGLKGTMNALYLKDLGDKTRRGMIASVLKGAVPGGVTFGYDKVEAISHGELVRGLRKINEEQAEVIRKIFRWFTEEGKSAYEICHILNRQSISSPKGTKWVTSTLVGSQKRKTGLLRQSLYKGEITFNRMTYKKHPQTGRRVSVLKPESEWMTVPIPELAIISEETFDKAEKLIQQKSQDRKDAIIAAGQRTKEQIREQKLREQQRYRARQLAGLPHNQYITSRRLHCGDCDEPIRSYKGKWDRCNNPDCVHHKSIPRDYSLEKTLKCLKNIRIKDILAFNNLQKDDLLKQKAELEQELENKRAFIRDLLESFDKARGRETMDFLDAKERECQGIRVQLKFVDKKLDELRPLKQAEAKTIKWSIITLLSKYETNPKDLSAVRDIQKIIRRIIITGERNYKIDYDIETLVKTYRPSQS